MGWAGLGWAGALPVFYDLAGLKPNLNPTPFWGGWGWGGAGGLEQGWAG